MIKNDIFLHCQSSALQLWFIIISVTTTVSLLYNSVNSDQYWLSDNVLIFN